MSPEHWPAYVPGDSKPAIAANAFDPSAYSEMALLHNPASSRAHETPSTVTALKHAGARHGFELQQLVETSPHHDDNVDTLRETVSPTTIVAVRSGDGGVSAVLSAVRAAKLANPVFVIPGGLKNDIARQLFSRRDVHKPARALAAATMREVRPTVADFTQATGEQATVDAFGYVSRGITSTVAATVNSKAYKAAREHDKPGERFIAERLLAIRAYLGGQHFSLDEAGDAIDVIASTGNLMAGELHPRASLLEPGFRLIKVRGKLSGLAILGALIARLPTGEFIGPNQSVELALGHSPNAYLQVDGEEYSLAGRTVLRLSVADSGVNALTTR